mgnify:CR=1 FL=1
MTAIKIVRDVLVFRKKLKVVSSNHLSNNSFSLLDISQTSLNLKTEPLYWRSSLGELLKIKLNQ